MWGVYQRTLHICPQHGRGCSTDENGAWARLQHAFSCFGIIWCMTLPCGFSRNRLSEKQAGFKTGFLIVNRCEGHRYRAWPWSQPGPDTVCRSADPPEQRLWIFRFLIFLLLFLILNLPDNLSNSVLPECSSCFLSLPNDLWVPKLPGCSFCFWTSRMIFQHPDFLLSGFVF